MRSPGYRLTILIAALTIAASATAAAPAKVDLSSPKSALRSFYQALLDHDVPALKTTVLDDPAHQQCAEALAEFTQAVVALEAVTQKTFATSLSTDGNPRV